MDNFVQRMPDPVCICLVNPQIPEISATTGNSDSHLFYDRFRRLCLCISFLHGPPTALRYMVSGWGRFDARGTNRLTNPVVCLAPFCRSWIRIARRTQTAFTLPLPEQVIMTSKI